MDPGLRIDASSRTHLWLPTATVSGKLTKTGTFTFRVRVTSPKTASQPKDKASGRVTIVVGEWLQKESKVPKGAEPAL